MDESNIKLNTSLNLALPEIIELIVHSDTALSAMEKTYEALHLYCGLGAALLEITENTLIFRYPYGLPEALRDITETRQSSAVHTVSLGPHPAPSGKLSFVFQSDSTLTENSLKSIGILIGQRFANERLEIKLELAEDKMRQRVLELAAIHEIGQGSELHNMPQLLNIITNRTARLMDAQACSILLHDSHSGQLRLAASCGLEGKKPIRSGGDTLAERALQSGKPMLILNASSDPRLKGLEIHPEMGSSMLAPMSDQTGKIFGVLTIRRLKPSPDFTPDDLQLFSVFAAQGALALSLIRLYDEQTRRADEMTQLSELMGPLLETTNMPELQERLVSEIQSIAGFDRCCLFLRHPSRPLFSAQYWKGYPDTIARNPVREGEGAVGIAARTGQILHYDTRRIEYSERITSALKGFARSLGTDSFLAAPVTGSNGRSIAVLVVDNRKRKAPISQRQRRIMDMFVKPVGLAIENAKLYAAMQESVENARKLRNYTEHLLRSLGVAILSTNQGGVLTHYNPSAERILALPGKEIRGIHLDQLIQKLDISSIEKDQLNQLLKNALRSRSPMQRHRLVIHPHHRPVMTIYLVLSPLSFNQLDSGGMVIIIEDITQEAGLEAEIDRIRRLADIGQLAAKMAHEVRNSLSPIRAGAQIVRREQISHNLSTEWPDIILAEVDSLTRLTTDLLEFARPIPLNPLPINVNDFLLSAIIRLKAALEEKSISISWELAPALPPIPCDSVLLQQAVRNLILNAIQAMEEGGKLSLRTRLQAAQQKIIIEIEDNGEGISEENLERVFQPFVTTRPKGTGLGLPIVLKIVHQHGGEIEVTSRVGKGTNFHIILPMELPRSTQPPLPMPMPRIRSSS